MATAGRLAPTQCVLLALPRALVTLLTWLGFVATTTTRHHHHPPPPLPTLSVRHAGKSVKRVDNLRTLAAASDYVTLHLPFIPGVTENLISDDFFMHMKVGWLVGWFVRVCVRAHQTP